MLIKVLLLIITLAFYECTLYSSFWAPLFNPRILNFRVDANMDPEIVKKYREQYVKKYGSRGEKLIEDLGNGKGPSDDSLRDTVKGMRDVQFYYTYPGANQDESYKYR